MGDPTGAQVLKRGLADEVLRWPLVQAEWGPALAALAEDRAFASVEPGAKPEAALPRFEGLSVLVADDNVVNREVAAEALHRCGVTAIRMAEDGRQALDLARGGGFDLILMDGSMPVLDGFDASRAIRADEAGSGARRVPIFALTAHVIGTAADAWREAGMDVVLVKPFTLADLARVLATVAPSANGRPEAAAADQVSPPRDEAAEAPLLDLHTLASLSEMAEASGPAFVERLLRLFREHAPTALDALQAAIAAGDVAAVASAAHNLKSMSANIGAAALARTLAQVERAARIDGTACDAALLPTLRTLCEETCAALEGHFAPQRRAA